MRESVGIRRRRNNLGGWLFVVGGMISLLGFTQYFSGGGMPTPGHSVAYFWAWEHPVGRIAIVVVGAGFALGVVSLTAVRGERIRRGLALAATATLLSTGIVLTVLILSCPLDAACITIGGILVGTGCLVAAAGPRLFTTAASAP